MMTCLFIFTKMAFMSNLTTNKIGFCPVTRCFRGANFK